jgi:hypothetical protein
MSIARRNGSNLERQLEETETIFHRRDGLDLVGKKASHRALIEQLMTNYKTATTGRNVSIGCLPIG